MPVTYGARRADLFERALRGESVPTDPDLIRLVALAERIPAIPVQMDPERKAAVRRRLLAVASVPEPRTGEERRPALPVSLGWRGRRRLMAAAAVAACLIAAAGVGVSASRSLPGDPFYAVKLAAESVQLDLTGGQYAKGRLELEFARTRLAEVRDLSAAGPAGTSAGTVISTLRRMDSETLAGSRDLTGYYQHTRRVAALRLLAGFAATQRRELIALLPHLPAAAQRQAMSALSLLGQVAQRSSALVAAPACSSICTGVPATDQLGVLPCPCTGQPGPAPSGTSGAPVSGSPTPGGVEPSQSPGTGFTASPSPTGSSGSGLPGTPSAPSASLSPVTSLSTQVQLPSLLPPSLLPTLSTTSPALSLP